MPAPRPSPRTGTPARRVRLRPGACAVVLALLAATGCASTLENRQAVIAIDGQWRLGSMGEGSFEEMVDAIRAIARQASPAPDRYAAVPELLRVAIENPSAWVRMEALRAAWTLGRELPATRLHGDALDRKEFNERTRRLEELILDPATANSPESLELAAWLADFRSPPTEPSLAVTIAEVVLSQALSRDDELGRTLDARMPGSLFHALAVTTLRSASDAYPVVREEALASARHLAPEDALELVAGILQRENDETVVLAALASLATLRAGLPAQRLAEVVGPLTDASDVAVRRRARELMAAP